jgi:Short C-terminal domain
MLFLYRPRQTWMPYQVPRQPTQQVAFNQHLQESYAATRRVPPAPSADNPVADLKDLAELHASGLLNDAEFAAAKAKLLGTSGP